jgi:hypothetical protein
VGKRTETPAPVSEKVCNRCGILKPIEDFVRRSAVKCGYSAHCKACHSETYDNSEKGATRRKKRNKDKKEELNANSREYYQKHRDGLLETAKEYRSRPEVKEQRQGYMKEWYQENREEVLETMKSPKGRDVTLRRKYGITYQDFERMLEEQANCCAICGSNKPRGNRGVFAVDHCHTTGKVRGLLCSFCNAALGLLQERIETLEAAIVYLRFHTENTPEECQEKSTDLEDFFADISQPAADLVSQ